MSLNSYMELVNILAGAVPCQIISLSLTNKSSGSGSSVGSSVVSSDITGFVSFLLPVLGFSFTLLLLFVASFFYHHV